MKIRTIDKNTGSDKIEILCVLLREIAIEFGNMNNHQLLDDINYINQYFNGNIKAFDDIKERIKKLDNDLIANGFNNYVLTDEEKQVLEAFRNDKNSMGG